MRGFIGCSLLLTLAVAGCNGDDDDMEPRDGGVDGGFADAGADGSVDAGPDGAVDAGLDGGGSPEAGLDAGGDGGVAACPLPEAGLPDEGLLALFAVGDEPFRAHITSETGMQQARDLWQGSSEANIPNGLLECEPEAYNCDYGWHLDPESIEFAEATIEVCDGAPSYIEENCASFGDRYCPWSAELVELRDCSEAGCPPVARAE